MGLLNPFEGTISFTGKKGNYMYVPEQPILYEGLTLIEHLELAAASYNMSSERFEEVSTRLLKKFKLEEEKDKLPTCFSKGMQQKVMLILGFMVEADVYIIDEPFMGLDPRAVKDLLSMLEIERTRGAGILMCTHALDTAEKVCNSFVLINKGRVVAKGDLQEIRKASQAPGESLFNCFLKITDE